MSDRTCVKWRPREDTQRLYIGGFMVCYNSSNTHELEHRPGNWCCVAQCDDGQTAITVADALQNFMRTGFISDDFHTRTRLVGEKEG